MIYIYDIYTGILLLANCISMFVNLCVSLNMRECVRPIYIHTECAIFVTIGRLEYNIFNTFT